MNDMQAVIDNQRRFHKEKLEIDVESLEGDERAAYIRDMTLALTDELHEMLNEAGWKPWATSRHLNRDAFAAELVDALHFFANLCLVAGVDAAELFAGYWAKSSRNSKRQDDGYEGTEKCRECGRALDDPHVACTAEYCAVRHPSQVTSTTVLIACPSCGLSKLSNGHNWSPHVLRDPRRWGSSYCRSCDNNRAEAPS